MANDRVESTDLAIANSSKLNQLVSRWQQQLESITAVAAQDLGDAARNKAKAQSGRSPVMKAAQEAGKPKRRQVLLGGEQTMVSGRHAFLMSPKDGKHAAGKPWIFYAPTLNPYPDKAESWMHQQFLDAGIAVAGIDVGEAYGSPHAIPFFDALYRDMVERGYSKKPALLGRSRGGLWVSSWALSNPARVAGIGGIYPVYDYTTYPGVQRAAAAYGVPAGELESRQAELNPVKRAGELANAKVPIFIIHGTDDKVVPITENSAAVETAYRQSNQSELFTLIRAPGQGHSFWEGFFHCQELVDFLIEKAKSGATVR